MNSLFLLPFVLNIMNDISKLGSFNYRAIKDNIVRAQLLSYYFVQ